MYSILMSCGGFADYDQISETEFDINIVTSPLMATSFSTVEEAVAELKAINQGGVSDETYTINGRFLQDTCAMAVVEVHYTV